MKPSRPFVAANFALTWDARITTRNRTPVDFSSRADKRRLLEIRARSDAVLIGKTTIERENFAMSLPAEDLRAERVRRGQAAYPIRVLVSNSGRINPNLKIFQPQHSFSPVLIFSTAQMPKSTQRALDKNKIVSLHLCENKTVDLAAMLAHLRKFYKIKHLVCEGGAVLFRSLLAAGLVDEINLTFCPRIFGGEKAPTITGTPGDFLPRGIACKLMKTEIVGDECFLRYRVGQRA